MTQVLETWVILCYKVCNIMDCQIFFGDDAAFYEYRQGFFHGDHALGCSGLHYGLQLVGFVFPDQIAYRRIGH
jgi:hypothetical protein